MGRFETSMAHQEFMGQMCPVLGRSWIRLGSLSGEPHWLCCSLGRCKNNVIMMTARLRLRANRQSHRKSTRRVYLLAHTRRKVDPLVMLLLFGMSAAKGLDASPESSEAKPYPLTPSPCEGLDATPELFEAK